MEEYNSLSDNKKYKILFVCLGNICRSAAAEEVFRTLAARAGRSQEFEADSAGMIDYHEGELPDARMRSHAARRGYRLTHRSRPVRPDDFARFDLVVAMDGQNERGLLRLAPDDEARRKVVRMAAYLTRHGDPEIPDPYYGGDEGFEHVLNLLEDAFVTVLVHPVGIIDPPTHRDVYATVKQLD